MKTKSIVSRMEKDSHVTIVFEMKGKNTGQLELEIRRAVHKWNRLLDNELSYKILFIDCEHNHDKEFLYPIYRGEDTGNAELQESSEVQKQKVLRTWQCPVSKLYENWKKMTMSCR